MSGKFDDQLNGSQSIAALSNFINKNGTLKKYEKSGVK
jgi:hypothetical protein